MEPNPSEIGSSTTHDSCGEAQLSNKLNLEMKNFSLADTSDFIHSLKLPSSALAIRTFIDAKNKWKKAGALYALISLHTKSPPVKTLIRMAGSFSDIASFLSLFVGKRDNDAGSQNDLELEDSHQNIGAVFQDGKCEVNYDPSRGSMSILESIKTSLPNVNLSAFLEKHVGSIKLVGGVLALICAYFGVDKLLRSTISPHFVSRIVALSSLTLGVKNIWKAASSVLDTILPFIYDFFGATYVAPEHARIADLAGRVQKLYTKARDTVAAAKLDFFGLQRQGVAGLEKEFADIEKAYRHLTESERSLYNFNIKMSTIQTYITELNDMIFNVYKSKAGKQQPTTLWLSGSAGIGKTHILNEIAENVANKHDGTIYHRTCADEFHSGYQHQTIFCLDDIGQSTDGKDIVEFHRYTSKDQKDVIGAAIGDKGKPFTSLYMLMSSNQQFIAPPTPLKDYEALNRRRDICIYCYNPHVTKYKLENDGLSPPPEFFDKFPTLYYLYNPVYGVVGGADQQNLANFPFRPNAEWVIRQVTLQEIIEGLYHLQQRRAEEFRRKLFSLGSSVKFPVPASSFKFDPEKFIHKPKPQVACKMIARPPSPDTNDVKSLGLVAINEFTSDDLSCLVEAFVECTGRRGSIQPDLTLRGTVGLLHHLSLDTDFWVAENGFVIANLGDEKLDAAGLEHAVRERIPHTVIDVCKTVAGYTAYIMVSSDDQSQASPGHHVKTTCLSPAVLISGPPGVGKTYALSMLDLKPWDWNSALTPDDIVFLDDFTISQERFDKAREILADYHDHQKYKFVVATFNKDSNVWNKSSKDDQSLMLRRSHYFHIDFTQSFKMRCRLYRKVPGILIREDESKRSSFISVHASYYPGSNYASLRPSMDTVNQVVRLEIENATRRTETLVFDNFSLPAPSQPHLHVILDHPVTPSFKGSQFLRRVGDDYEPLTFLEKATCSIMFADFVSKFSSYTIADRSMAPSIVNSKGCKNSTKYKSILISSEDWAIGVETIDGILIAYNIDDESENLTEISYGSYIFRGKPYFIETQLDCQFALLVAKNCGRLDEMLRAIERTEIAIPTIENTVQASPIISAVNNCISLLDIVSNLSFAGVNLFLTDSDTDCDEDDEEFPEARPTRGGKNQTPQQSFCQSCGKPDSPNHKCAEPKAKFEQYIPEGRPTRGAGKTQDSPKHAPCESCGRPDSPNHKCAEPKNWYESNIDTSDFALACIPEGDGEWMGVAHAGRFYWMQETKPGLWFGFVKDLDDTVTVIQTIEGKKRDPLLFNSILGKTLRVQDAEVGEMVAKYLCFGKIPEQADVASFVRSLPKPIQERSADEHKEMIDRQEGMYDVQADCVIDVIMANKIPLHHNGVYSLSAIRLWDRVCITNAHAPEGCKAIVNGVEYDIHILAVSKRNDTMLFEIVNTQVQACKSIRNHIASIAELGQYLGICKGRTSVMIGLGTPDKIKIHMANSDTFTSSVSSKEEAGTIRYFQRLGYFGYTGVTKPGDCGSPVILMAPSVQRKFIGIHSAGRVDASTAAPITIEYLDDMLQDKENTNQAGKVVNTVRQCPYIDYFPEDRFHRSEELGALVVGNPRRTIHVPTSTTKYKSGLRWDTATEPSLTGKYDPRNPDGHDPLIKGFSKYSQPQTVVLNQDEINEAADCVGNYIADVLIREGLTTRLFTNTESINGAPHAEFPNSKPIDRQGAVGYPYNLYAHGRTNKQDFLRLSKDGRWYFIMDDPVSQEILSDTDLLFADGLKGISHDVPWVAYPKDEPVKIKKIYDLNARKTRVFFSGPMSYQLAYRRAFGAALWRINEIYADIPIRVGINPRSLEWQNLAYQHLAKNSMGFDSDMSNWDGSVPIEFIRAIPRVYNIIYRLTDPDWQPSHDLLRQALHRPIEGATVIIYDKVYKLDHAMASGCPGTAIENSIINWMLFFLCWKKIMSKQAPSYASFSEFMKHSCLSVYGDDNIFTCAEHLAQFFHFNSFKTVAEEFGFSVTDALKQGGVMPNLKPFTDLTFLKRSFLVESWKYLPALEIDSIEKSLGWINCSPAYKFRGEWRVNTLPDVYIGAARLSFMEMSLWGKDLYDQLADKVRKALWNTGITFPIPPYEESRKDSGL